MDHDLDLYESLDIHRHVTIRYSMCYFLYTCSIVTESVSPAVYRDIEPKRRGDVLSLSGSRDVINHVTIPFAI